jgi:TfoX/Sxy family transcriptional regulator of competence genes
MDNIITGERIADLLIARGISFEQKRMFGGVCFMVDDKMCLGTYKGSIMARVDPAEEEQLSQRTGAAPMVHGGRAMPGFMMIDPEGYESDANLEFWVEKSLEYNPKVKVSKKKKSGKS